MYRKNTAMKRKDENANEQDLQGTEARDLRNAALTGAAADTVRRFGRAVSAYGTSYNGYDPATGRTYDRSLKSVGEYAVDPNNPQRSYQQHAGFSAEILETADRNAEHAINDDGGTSARTDDLDHTDPRYNSYSSNDQYVDLVELDENGNPITDSETQVKFVGNSPEACLDKLASKKFQKYLDRGVRLMIPKDYYEEVINEADRRIEDLQEQLEHAKELGNTELVRKLETEIEHYQQIKESLVPSHLTKKMAEFAAEHPEAATGIRIGETVLRAGAQSAAVGAMFGGAISIVSNVTAYEQGEITKEEARQNVARDTARSAECGFVTASEGALLTGALENSKDIFLQEIGVTNAPVMIVQAAHSSFRIMKQYSEGKIDAMECVSLLCETTASEGAQGATAKVISEKVGSLITTKLGSLKIGRTIGGAVGGVAGYIATQVTLKALRQARAQYHGAREYRIMVEDACETKIAQMKVLQDQIRCSFNHNMQTVENGLSEANTMMDLGIERNDVFTYLEGVSRFRKTVGFSGHVMTPLEFEGRVRSDQKLAL